MTVESWMELMTAIRLHVSDIKEKIKFDVFPMYLNTMG
jgi:hypothetical protein